MDITEVDFKHRVPIQIRFNDIDSFRHVNNTAYFEYCDYARLRYFEELKGQSFSVEKVELVIASIKMDFLIPIIITEDIFIKTKIYEVGKKSLKMIQIIENNKEIKAICDSVMVGFNGKESVEIDEELKKKIALNLV